MKRFTQLNSQLILWTSLSGLCLLVSLAGSTYAFGIFAPLLTKHLGYTQRSLDMIASVGNSGLYVSLLVGFAVEMYGVHPVVKFGGVLVFVGFIYIWLAIQQAIPTNPVLLGLFYFIAQAGSCCHISTAVTAAVRIFPAEGKGTAIGLVKGYFGLSTAVLANLSIGYFTTKPSMFVLCVALLIPTTGLVGVSLVVIPPVPCAPEAAPVWFARHWLCLFATLLGVGTLMYTVKGAWIRPFSATLLLMLIVSLPAIPYYFYPVSPSVISEEDATATAKEGGEDQPLLPTVTPFTLYHSEESFQDTLPLELGLNLAIAIETATEHRSISLRKALDTWQMWALCYIFFALSGAGLMVIYNVLAISTAVGLPASPYTVSLIALSNGLGRMCAGLGADYAGKLIPQLTRLHLLAVVAVCMSMIQGMLSIGEPATIIPGILAIGFLFGCTVSLVAVNATDIFGPDHVATIFGFVDTSPIFGSFVFASLVVNGFYSYNTIDDEGRRVCLGKGCFEGAFLISAVACTAAAVFAFYMNYTRKSVLNC